MNDFEDLLKMFGMNDKNTPKFYQEGQGEEREPLDREILLEMVKSFQKGNSEDTEKIRLLQERMKIMGYRIDCLEKRMDILVDMVNSNGGQK